MKKKRLIVILSLLVIIIGATFAWVVYNVTEIAANFTVQGPTVTYSDGPNISGIHLLPATTKEIGVANNIAVYKEITVTSSEDVCLNLYLNVEKLDSGLKYDHFVWEIYNGETRLNSGNFGNVNEGDRVTLLSNALVPASTTIYKLYIWLDGSVDNPETVEGQDFKFVLNGEIDYQGPIMLASDKIIQLAGDCTSWNTGFSGVCATSPYDDNGTTKYHEYRYVGAEPNNYVKFNDDLYQIIGVFDKNSYDRDSVEGNDYGDYLMKLILADTLTATSWGATNTADAYTTYSAYNNNWETANANILLNEYFLNASNTSTTYKACSDWTYYYNDNNYKTKNCSKIIGYGIQTADLRNYIQPVTWYLKGYNSNSYSKQNFYTCERSDTETISNCTSGNQGAYATKVEDKSIGLMYVSDYLYASGYYASTNTSTAAQYYYGQQNWLYNGYEWTITPQGSGSTTAFYVSNGFVSYGSTRSPCALRPTFYLKSTIKIKSGAGTIKNPFVIG